MTVGTVVMTVLRVALATIGECSKTQEGDMGDEKRCAQGKESEAMVC